MSLSLFGTYARDLSCFFVTNLSHSQGVYGGFNLKRNVTEGNGSNFRNNKKDFDSVNISDIELAKGVINKLPDIREDVVEKVKERYDNSNYEEDPEDVAEKMLEKIKLLKISEEYNNNE